MEMFMLYYFVACYIYTFNPFSPDFPLKKKNSNREIRFSANANKVNQ